MFFLPLATPFPVTRSALPFLSSPFFYSLSICYVQRCNAIFMLKDSGEIIYWEDCSLIVSCLTCEVLFHVNEKGNIYYL